MLIKARCDFGNAAWKPWIFVPMEEVHMARICAYGGVVFSVVMAFGGNAPAADFGLQTAPSVIVNYSDLDVSRPTGAQALVERIRFASQAVCGGKPDNRDLSRFMAYRACVDQAMDNAVKSTELPLVADVYGKPQLVAENRPADTSLVTSAIPAASEPTQVATAEAPKKSLGNRIASFFSDLLP